MNIIRRYPCSCLCIVVIWVLCFCTPPQTPLDNISMIDKWTHIVMYLGTCSVIWVEYAWRSIANFTKWLFGKRPKSSRSDVNWHRIITWGWLMPVFMSGLIEILQANCTGGRRSGEWFDFLANSIGCTLALIIFASIVAKITKKNKG